MYRYELWFDHCCLHEEDGFETVEEAYEEAREEAEYRINYWKEEGAYRGETIDNFEFKIEVE